MSKHNKEITIFYSWQSDLPDDTNRRAIRTSLREASNKVENEFSNDNVVITLDEATRAVSGSPNIPATILEKIEASDIFIADVSIINSSTIDSRPCPNPNVVYELGFATAHLGWERIIMLFNTKYGELSADLPFDFDRHRVSIFTVNDKSDKDGKNKLSNLLFIAIKSILENNPERASEQKELSEKEKKEKRDISNIKWALSSLHIPTLDQHILDSPHMLMDKVLYFWEGYNGILTNSLFHLYDKNLEKEFKELHKYWGVSIRYYQFYHSNMRGNVHIFSNPGDGPFTKNQQKAWDKIVDANSKMRKSLDQILKLVRQNYLDVDIDDTNKQAWNEYVNFKKEQALALE